MPHRPPPSYTRERMPNTLMALNTPHAQCRATALSEFPPLFKQSTAQRLPCDDCIMVQWCGIWLGIESDGYTHS